MGLGLAVVRFFVELHRGTVQVATGPQGSSFSFTLPILSPSGQTPSLAYQI
jgi:signal transduction histidine kinase